ncbi:glycosyltransferase [Paenibacillus silvisoli]|uniref:glycosyltransferase n=1 Tax=Paenibacillus silvisoli TaxID=3110539 RepID=UPI002803C3C9|nr:glycosyltransferase [Paenibacillus silvisoli]
MRLRKQWISLALAGALLALWMTPVSAGAGTAAQQDHHAHRICYTQSMVDLNKELRRLWAEHVYWTRTYIVSATEGLADKDTVLQRLLRNQQELGNAIKPYYGDKAGDKLAELLREHIVIAGKITAAAMAGNQAEVEKLNKEWYRNGDDIVKFLSGANPNLAYNDLKTMFDRHLQLVTAALTTRLKKDWNGDVLAFDEGIAHIMKFADILTAGIISQFPQKFK